MKISFKETEAFDRGEFKGNVYVQKHDGKDLMRFWLTVSPDTTKQV